MWKLEDTALLEKQFGTLYREYMLPLENKETGECEIYLYPYPAFNLGKSGSEIILVKKLTDLVPIFRSFGNMVSPFLLASLTGFAEEIYGGQGGGQGIVGRAIGYGVQKLGDLNGNNNSSSDAGGLLSGGNLMNEALAQNPEMQGLISAFFIPKPILVRLNPSGRDIATTYAGFLYMAHMAALEGNWGKASHFLEAMGKRGKSFSKEDYQQLLFLFKIVICGRGFSAALEIAGKQMENQNENRMQDISPFLEILKPAGIYEAAFRVKLALVLMKIQHEMGVYYQQKEDEFLKVIKWAAILPSYGYYLTHQEKWQETLTEVHLSLSEEEKKEISKHGALFEVASGAFSVISKMTATEAKVSPLKVPSLEEVETLIPALVEKNQPNLESSLDALHEREGKMPKWETVIAHFWDYVEWILDARLPIQLKPEDFAFLAQELPENLPLRAEVDIARRVLLTMIAMKQDAGSRTPAFDNGILSNGFYRASVPDIQTQRQLLPDFASMQKTARKYEKSLVEEGSGLRKLLRLVRLAGYKGYQAIRLHIVNQPVLVTHAGNPRMLSDLEVFKKDMLNALTIYFINPLKEQKKEGYLLGVQGNFIEPPSIEEKAPKKVPKMNIFDRKNYYESTNAKEFVQYYYDAEFVDRLQSIFLMLSLLKVSEHLKEPAQRYEILHALRPFMLSFLERFFNSPHPFDKAFEDLLKGLETVSAEFGTPFDFQDNEVLKLLNGIKNGLRNPFEEFKRRFPQGPEVVKREWAIAELRPGIDPIYWESATLRSQTNEERNVSLFVRVNTGAYWDQQADNVQTFFPKSKAIGESYDKKINERVLQALPEVKEALKNETSHAIESAHLKVLERKMALRLEKVTLEAETHKKELLKMAREHCHALGISQLYSDFRFCSSEEILATILRRVREGRIAHPQSLLSKTFVGIVIDFLLASTEGQQLKKGTKILEALKAHQMELQKKGPPVTQELLNKDVEWVRMSSELLSTLKKGSNRLRYAKKTEIEGREIYVLHPPRYAIKYLVEDYFCSQVMRAKAIEAIEKIDPPDGSKGVSFMQAIMGVGKSSVICPLLVELAIEKGKVPVLMTKDNLIPQLTSNLQHIRPFHFRFDVHYGMEPPKFTSENHEEAKKKFEEEIDLHLKSLLISLQSLKEQGRFVLTTPTARAALHNKCKELEDQMAYTPKGEDQTKVFERLQRVKEIFTFFKDKQVIDYIDEDSVREITFEYHTAYGSAEVPDPRYVEICHKFVDTLMEHQDLQIMLVDNNLRSLPEAKKALKPIVEKMLEDMDYWLSKGWKKDDWKKVLQNKEKVIEYLLGIGDSLNKLPSGLPEWDPSASEEKLESLRYLAALHRFANITFESVYLTHAFMRRGINKEKGSTVVPYLDGNQKPMTEYGDQGEILLHTYFHYAIQTCEEEFFSQALKKVSRLDKTISIDHQLTWVQWTKSIEEFRKRHFKLENGTKKPLSTYEAFSYPLTMKQRQDYLRALSVLKEGRRALQSGEEATWFAGAKEDLKFAADWFGQETPSFESLNDFIAKLGAECFAMPKARIAFMAYVIKESRQIKVYSEKIFCNSQDLTIGEDLSVLSGTGDIFSLNLIHPKEQCLEAERDEILAQMMLLIDLKQETLKFNDAFTFIEKMVADPTCRAIINCEHETISNTEKLIALLRQKEGAKNRQFIYCDSKTGERMIWNPGDSVSPIRYEDKLVNKQTSFALYDPPSTRGTHISNPQGEDIKAITMVGLSTDLESFQQALGRMRQLGFGQTGLVAIDPKMEALVRTDNKLGPQEQVLVGHVIKTIKSISLRYDEMRHVKAAVYKGREVIKRHLDPVLMRPFTSFEGLDPTNRGILIDFSSLLAIHHRSLSIQSNEIFWEQEYLPNKKIDALEFLTKLYKSELQRLDHFRNGHKASKTMGLQERMVGFLKALNNGKETAKIAKIIERCWQRGNKEIQKSVVENPDLTSHQKTVILHLISTYVEIENAYESCRKELQGKLDAIENDKDVKTFFSNYLPAEIETTEELSSNVQQQVQQQMQVQQNKDIRAEILQPRKNKSTGVTIPLTPQRFEEVINNKRKDDCYSIIELAEKQNRPIPDLLKGFFKKCLFFRES